MRYLHQRPNKVIYHLIKGSTGVDMTKLTENYWDLIQKESNSRGIKETCSYCKSLYVQAVKIACALPFSPLSFRKSNRNGVAKDLFPYLPFLNGNVNEKRAALTSLRTCYLLQTHPDVSVKTITGESTGTWDENNWDKFSRWLESSQVRSADCSTNLQKMIRRSRIPTPGKFFYVPRAVSGPNGSSSLFSSHKDALALVNKPKLLEHIDFITKSNVSESITTLGLWYQTEASPENSFNTGKLIGLSEGGCKTRVIAVADIFTQSALKPLHDSLMKRLGEINQDGTWDQSRLIQIVKKWTKLGRNMYSFDLSAATDRFPLRLQEIVIQRIYGQKFSVAWSDLIAKERDFFYQANKKDPVQVKYGVGQPMGIYSSWPTFSLSHHILIKYAGFLEGRKDFNDYVVLGDDVMIRGKRVASRYRALVTSLGVAISETKSLISESKPHSAEIAKAILHNGIDLSPIPPKLLIQVSRDELLLPSLLNWIRERYEVPSEHLRKNRSLFVDAIYKRSRQRKRATILLYDPIPPKADLSQVIGGNHNLPEDENPWGGISPQYSLQDIATVKGYLRKVDILQKYDNISDEWMETPDFEYEGLTLPDGQDDPKLIHPVHLSYEYIVNQIDEMVEEKIDASILDTWVKPMDDFKVGRLADPSMRNFQALRVRKAQQTSHLTLQTLECLKSGELPNYNLGDEQLPEWLLEETTIPYFLEKTERLNSQLKSTQGTPSNPQLLDGTPSFKVIDKPDWYHQLGSGSDEIQINDPKWATNPDFIQLIIDAQSDVPLKDLMKRAIRLIKSNWSRN